MMRKYIYLHITTFQILTTFMLIDTAMTNPDHLTDMCAGVPDSSVVTVTHVAAK